MSAALSSKGHRQIRRWPLLICLFLLLFLHTDIAAARPLIVLQVPASLLGQSVTGLAIQDTLSLLSRSFPTAEVSLNRKQADIRIILPELPKGSNATEFPRAVPALSDQSYCWSSRRRGRITVLVLTATTREGVASGLYGLLQEQLGIRFIHPRQTIVPVHLRWPLKATAVFSGQPRFRQRGFHLHTLHPMELTEQLHDPRYPGGFEELKQYLDWLARNGQNTFQFFLLRGVDRQAWIPHAGRIVAYAHSRGIRCGIEISLAMIQQQAFQAITLLRPFPSYREQIEQSLSWLFQVPWDFMTVEPMMGEHLPLVGRLLPAAQKQLEELVTGNYQCKLLLATHVIRQRGGEPVRRPRLPGSGILIHTVMCYSATEPKAPVYGNCNQQFMFEAARAESGKREVWYWPESSYWIGFDSSVPLLLLPYLDSRWDDLRRMQEIGVQGHLTFSSGWEWGYWLPDWSIARWSWVYSDNGRVRPDAPLSGLADLFPDPALTTLWQKALALQNLFLKEKELLRFMAAATPFSELPAPFDLPFQPVPDFSYSWLLHDATEQQLEPVIRGPVADLEQYAARMARLTDQLDARISRLAGEGRITQQGLGLSAELVTGLRVTALRAAHRALTLRALISRHRKAYGGRKAFSAYLAQAASIRLQALVLVRQQEQRYRYPVELLARRRISLTAYPFGYLYPASTLFFWEREEGQARYERFDPFFMNLWDIRRTLGLESLFFR